jgi:2-keto-4-pentenoate hydratase/2-oxohepta-3-ene-1,7-dioic acid hydratase in catechol pathway
MRLCRFKFEGKVQVGVYGEETIAPLGEPLLRAYADATHETLALSESTNLLDYLPPTGQHYEAAKKIAAWLANAGAQGAAKDAAASFNIATSKVELLTPIASPNKLFLLAGNYAAHIKEGGGVAAERAETFPYVFMKPPSTTLTDPNKPVMVPASSPKAVDWELELAVVIGRRGKHITEAAALSYVAGYTIVNDISDRKFRPNPSRKERERDKFFDWMHGKWHDSFCPCGPCITSSDEISDPQRLAMKLTVNGAIKQNASTEQQIFPVAAVIEFISNICTLEPGDIIATGTPAGVGNATGEYLHPGDKVEASIAAIGTLVSPVVAEAG